MVRGRRDPARLVQRLANRSDYRVDRRSGHSLILPHQLYEVGHLRFRAGVFKAFGRTKRGRARDDVRVLNRPAFVDAKNLQPYINQGLEAVLKTIEYTAKNGAIVEGYNAEILPKICELYLDVRAGKDSTGTRVYQTSVLNDDLFAVVKRCVLHGLGLSTLTKHV